MVRVISVTVAIKDKDRYIIERGDVVLYITGGPERAEINVRTDEKNDPAGKRNKDKDNIRDLIIPGVNDND
jgi:hypothetical protein